MAFWLASPQQAADEFVNGDAQARPVLRSDAQPLDVSAYVWSNERSPLNTPLLLLPPMFVDITQAAFGALTTYLQENGGRFGPLVIPETQMERMIREACAHGRCR